MAFDSTQVIRIDPATGLKLFDTRAGKASEKIDGRGYGVIENAKYLVLPEFKADAAYDDAARAQIREFNEVRRGADDYMAMEGKFARYLEDHYSTAPEEPSISPTPSRSTRSMSPGCLPRCANSATGSWTSARRTRTNGRSSVSMRT